MKKVICYLRTIRERETFLGALFNLGGIYVAHDYKEMSKDKIKCQTCGDISIGWRRQ